MRAKETLTYVNERGERISFSPASLYHVNMRDVAGLSDIQNEIYRFNAFGQDGDTYLGNRILARDIEIIGRINARNKEETQKLRRELSRILNPQFNAKLIYDLGGFRRVISCKVDGALDFIRQPVLEQFTIQLSCLHPFWREESETQQDIAAWIGGLEFPTPNGLEIPIEGTWEVGFRQPSLIVNVINRGDVRAGMQIAFRAQGALSGPSLLNINTGEFVKLGTISQPFHMIAGDVVTVTTGYGEKGVILRRQRDETSAIRFLDIDSTYLQLEVGDNFFRYAADVNADNLEVTIRHNNFFLGV